MSNHVIRRSFRAVGHAMWVGLQVNGAYLSGLSTSEVAEIRCANGDPGCPPASAPDPLDRVTERERSAMRVFNGDCDGAVNAGDWPAPVPQESRRDGSGYRAGDITSAT